MTPAKATPSECFSPTTVVVPTKTHTYPYHSYLRPAVPSSVNFDRRLTQRYCHDTGNSHNQPAAVLESGWLTNGKS